MAHGQSDFGAYAKKSTTYGLADMGELAVRLGSVVSYDRRGDVVWIEKFNNGMTNWSAAGAAGHVVEESALESLSDGVSLRTVAPNAGGFNAIIYRHDELPVNSRLGLECAFLPDGNANDIHLYFSIVDGINTHIGYIRIRMDDGAIDYQDDATGWKPLLSGFKLKRDGTTWHHAKMVVDYDPLVEGYARFLLDNNEYNMTGISLWNFGAVVSPYLVTQFNNVYAGGVLLPVVYFDNLILTQNEP